MHHRDLGRIRMAEDTGDVFDLLAKRKPHIVVDASGVGRITCQENQQPREPVSTTQPVPGDGGAKRSSFSWARRHYELVRSSNQHRPNLLPEGAKDYERLWKDVTNTTDKGKAVHTLAEILSDKEGRNFISRLRRKDAELCIEILDHGIAEHKLKVAEKQDFFVTLRRLAGIHGRVPDSIMITENIEVGEEIRASGGFADTRAGRYKGHLVAVKILRVSMQDDILKIRKQFCKELVLWSTLSHPNVLKPVGVQGDMEKGQFVTVSEWTAHGNIMEYIKNNHTNRLELLHGAAQGLEYLHRVNLTHGDLKGANILISNDVPSRACLADFSSMTMVLDPDLEIPYNTRFKGGTIPFTPPELLLPSRFGFMDSVPTPQADIYAFGLVIYQVLTGEIPFRRLRQTELAYSVVKGLRPNKPENPAAIGFSDSLWDFVQQCWDDNRELRPTVSEVVIHLEAAAANWRGLMPPCLPVDNVVPDLEEMSGLMERCEFRTWFSTGIAHRATTQTIFSRNLHRMAPRRVQRLDHQLAMHNPITYIQNQPNSLSQYRKKSWKLVSPPGSRGGNLGTPSGYDRRSHRVILMERGSHIWTNTSRLLHPTFLGRSGKISSTSRRSSVPFLVSGAPDIL
ncbi:kinase-like protein [Thelephora ganbajun]|uniref:Kinase-like protein n=1 Tax=Thelephora ganbajun TaxID=370292 RepID=A0ACB6Z512_THEGA|nr:kinase-like protein [Thelephora ganbajun]